MVPEAQLDGGTYYKCPIFLLPFLMPLHEEGFDLSFVLAPYQFFVPKPARQIQRRIVVRMIAVMADHTAKRALVRSIGSIDSMAAMALL